MRPLNRIAEWHNVTDEVFNKEIQPLGMPAVLKGVVNDWPIVKAAQRSETELLEYMKSDYVGGSARFISQSGDEDGYYFYNKDYSGFNFTRHVAPLDTVFQMMQRRRQDRSSDRVSIQSAPVNEYFKSIAKENSLSLMSSDVEPRFWMGNDGVVNTHYDDSENIACVVSGTRKFTLFPPEQVSNLYIGPLENTPGGAPVSMVKLKHPDLAVYPKFKTALKHALTAELSAGDAIYIPTLWWHHVESMEGINVLINYWQGGSIEGLDHPSGLDLVLMGLISLAKLPNNQKQAWKYIFDHLVMSENSEFDYIPEQIKGVLGASQLNNQKNIEKWLRSVLSDTGA